MSAAKDRVPVIETREEYEEYHRECINKYLPGLLVTTIPYRKYASVEFDFVLVSGWRLLERKDRDNRKLSASLSDQAIETLEEIVKDYRSEVAPSESKHGLSIGSNPGFYSTPKMGFESARKLAEEMRPIVNDRSKWIVYPKNHDFDEDRIVKPEKLRSE